MSRRCLIEDIIRRINQENVKKSRGFEVKPDSSERLCGRGCGNWRWLCHSSWCEDKHVGSLPEALSVNTMRGTSQRALF